MEARRPPPHSSRGRRRFLAGCQAVLNSRFAELRRAFKWADAPDLVRRIEARQAVSRGDMGPGPAALRVVLVVLAQPSVAVEPAERPLRHPATPARPRPGRSARQAARPAHGAARSFFSVMSFRDSAFPPSAVFLMIRQGHLANRACPENDRQRAASHDSSPDRPETSSPLGNNALGVGRIVTGPTRIVKRSRRIR